MRPRQIATISTNIHQRGRWFAAGLDPASIALFARMTPDPTLSEATPGLTYAQWYDQYWIKPLKLKNLWNIADAIHVQGTGQQQWANLNLKSSSFTLLPVNTPTWIANRGYNGDAVASYLNTQYNPFGGALNYKQNSATIAAYNRLNRAASNVKTLMGNGSQCNLYPFLGGSLLRPRLNDLNASGIVVAGSHGFSLGTRNDGSNVRSFKNGISLGDTAIASAAIGSGNIYLLAFNNGSPIHYTDDQIPFSYVGGGITDQQSADLYAIAQAALTVIGANV